MWYCYLLYSESANRTYIGITNNLTKRLKQHNQLITGGAKSTKITQDWYYYLTVKMPNKSTALSYEYQWKKSIGLEKRVKKCTELINQFNLSIESIN